MIINVTLDIFRNYMNNSRPENFTYEGLEVLFNHLESFDECSGSQTELDLIAICCEYSEAHDYEILEEFDEYETIEDFVVDNDALEIPGTYRYIYQNV